VIGDPRDSDPEGQDGILRDVLAILAGVVPGWETGFAGPITAETRLGEDLAIESIHLVRFAVAVQERFRRQDLPFQELLVGGDGVVRDLRVRDVVDFLSRHLIPPSRVRGA
jgi:acyl carrier protein